MTKTFILTEFGFIYFNCTFKTSNIIVIVDNVGVLGFARLQGSRARAKSKVKERVDRSFMWTKWLRQSKEQLLGVFSSKPLTSINNSRLKLYLLVNNLSSQHIRLWLQDRSDAVSNHWCPLLFEKCESGIKCPCKRLKWPGRNSMRIEPVYVRRWTSCRSTRMSE